MKNTKTVPLDESGCYRALGRAVENRAPEEEAEEQAEEQPMPKSAYKLRTMLRHIDH
jgi:hypothetical protein